MKKNKCIKCSGNGRYSTHSEPSRKCEVCKGTGKVDCTEPLTFDKLRVVNYNRCVQDIRPIHDWTPLEWGGALAGETGELCNFLKKMRRGEIVEKKNLAHELADIITYADLLAAA